ncbi:ribonuclease HII [Rhodobacteraceae bacterium 2CG4]|uniref:Ribonuclease HII n=1 Tax=Halovulum marinum TaxID=2662447 RepID=A0A6L5Z321_9RHOB|nr:ribonuclease HII [Halovulum marinum]MSU90470.1 ribonuclease HII [Halovulum marinum]
MTARGMHPVCGIDEAGRGPWAGPVVAAAVILDPAAVPEGIDDSKKLTARRREALFLALRGCAQIGIGAASVREIDRINILQASYLAMRRAVAALPVPPRRALIDGNGVPGGLPCPGQAIVGGDGTEPAIAAASIVAKVTRDRIMVALAQQYPGYGWDTNVGYGVKAHFEALQSLGVTPHHRRSFKPVHKILCQEDFVTL